MPEAGLAAITRDWALIAASVPCQPWRLRDLHVAAPGELCGKAANVINAPRPLSAGRRTCQGSESNTLVSKIRARDLGQGLRYTIQDRGRRRVPAIWERPGGLVEWGGVGCAKLGGRCLRYVKE